MVKKRRKYTCEFKREGHHIRHSRLFDFANRIKDLHYPAINYYVPREVDNYSIYRLL